MLSDHFFGSVTRKQARWVVSVVLCASIFWALSATIAQARTVYINDRRQITFRTGPGSKYEILDLLKTGDRMELLEEGEEWSHVRLPDGKEGWVLKQYISATKPIKMQLEELEKAHSSLTSQSDELGQENEALKEANNKVNAALEEKTKALADLTKQFNELKQSSDASSFQMRKYLIFFFSGAGILFIGILLGLVMKRQRRKSMYMV
jgi:SH3 domain protein